MIELNDRWLQSFLVVTKNGSITKAAAELFLSPQALFQQINLLEQSIDIKLFDRGRRGVSLTSAGKEFHKGIQQTLNIYQATLEKCHKIHKKNHTIRIPVMSSIIIPKFMEQICSIYKEKNADTCFSIEMIPTRFSIDSLINGLKNNEYDIIEYFTLDGYHPKEIYYEKFEDIQTWCLLQKNHPLAGKDCVSPDDLDGFCISTTQIKLLRYLQAYVNSSAINVAFEEIPPDRYKIIKACESNNICFLNEDIAKDFTGFACMPLDFDCKVESGLGCQIELASTFSPFFEAARIVSCQTL